MTRHPNEIKQQKNNFAVFQIFLVFKWWYFQFYSRNLSTYFTALSTAQKYAFLHFRGRLDSEVYEKILVDFLSKEPEAVYYSWELALSFPESWNYTPNLRTSSQSY